MIPAIADRLQPPAASRTALRPIRVVTNASLSACEHLQGLGFVVQTMDQASTTDADIVVIDRSLTTLWNPLDAQKIKSPVVFVDGLASPEVDYASDTVNGDDAALTRALALAASLSNGGGADLVEEGLTCGKLRLENSCAFWDGVDLDLTIGEYKIVELLVSRPGHYCTYRDVYDRLRHKGFIAGEGPRGYWANVRSAMKRIRSKFRALDPAFAEIENYISVGYGWRKPE